MENEYKNDRADYRYTQGIVGQYCGQDVCVIPKRHFTLMESRANPKMIYAIADRKEDQLALVGGGMWIGNMSPDGYVELFEKSRFYGEEAEPKETREATPAFTDEVVEMAFLGGKGTIPQVDITLSSGRSIDDYLAGETLVDRFLREMSF